MRVTTGASLRLIIGLTFLAFSLSDVQAAATPPSNAMLSVTEGSSKFAMDLYMALKDDAKNLVVSPFGVQIVSAMLAEGAKENTLSELKKVMHFPEDLQVLRHGYKELLQSLKDPQLQMANNLFPEKHFKLNHGFVKQMVNYYSTIIEPLPFAADPTSSARKINDWARNNTNGKITDIVTADDLQGAALVLANAIYFKAKWKYTFNKELTVERKFHTSKDTHVKVQMMSIKKYFHYAHVPELKAKILAMPYSEDKFRMVVFLPDDIDGLPQVEKSLHEMGIAKALERMQELEVDVRFPRFKIESDLNLRDTLGKLGLNDLFSRQCNLSGITDEAVKVDQVKQKALIEVNEEGTEAAAVTVVGVVFTSLPAQREPEFIVDRPFVSVILNAAQNPTVVFVSRHLSP